MGSAYTALKAAADPNDLPLPQCVSSLQASQTYAACSRHIKLPSMTTCVP